jgi:hypothetical protein
MRMAASAGGAATLLYDTFTDPDGTLLTNHAPDIDLAGNGWEELGGSSIINNNAAVKVGGGLGIGVNVGAADVTITCDVTVSNATNNPHGVIFRAVDANNMWWLVYDAGPGAAAINLLEINAGTLTARDSVTETLTDGTYAFKIVASGSLITCYVNDVEKVSFSSAFLAAATRHGLRPANTPARFDNLLVVAL